MAGAIRRASRSAPYHAFRDDRYLQRGSGVPAEPGRAAFREPVRVRADRPARVPRPADHRRRRRVGRPVRRHVLVRPRAVRVRASTSRATASRRPTGRRCSRPSCGARSCRSTGCAARSGSGSRPCGGAQRAAKNTLETEWPKAKAAIDAGHLPMLGPHPPFRPEPVRARPGPPGPRVRLHHRRRDRDDHDPPLRPELAGPRRHHHHDRRVRPAPEHRGAAARVLRPGLRPEGRRDVYGFVMVTCVAGIVRPNSVRTEDWRTAGSHW